MEEFMVHRVRFFEYIPSPIHCMAYDKKSHKFAISRANNFIEIWDIENRWFLEKVVVPNDGESIEAMCWCKGRLFSVGLHGFLQEYDLQKLTVKKRVSSNNGAIWCMTKNKSEDRIAVGTEDGAVVIFEVTDDEVDYEKAFEKQEARIFAITWCDQQKAIITGSVDNIRVWSIANGRAIRRMSLARSANLQETIVWTVSVCKDFTIVSGDSRGITSFWNGHQGTLIKAFNYHKADVLSIAVNETGSIVYSAGIDANIVKFEYLPVNSKVNSKKPENILEKMKLDEDEDADEIEPWSRWIRTTVHTQHTHDIRCLVVADAMLFSGGVDCQLVCNSIQESSSFKSKKKFASVPNESLVRVAQINNILVLQYPKKLDIWRLGCTTSKPATDKELHKLHTRPRHLITLKSSGNRHVLHSAISDDGQWLAYTHVNGVKVFKLHYDNLDSDEPTIKVKAIKVTCNYDNILKLYFKDQYLVTLGVAGNIQMISLKIEDECLMNLKTIVMPDDMRDCFKHVMCISKNHIAVGSLSGDCVIFSIDNEEVYCRLPKRESPISAMVFTPSGLQLNAFYTDRKIIEFSLETLSFTDWSRSLPPDFHPQWQQRRGVVTSAFYRGNCSTRLYLQDDYSFCYIDKTMKISDKNTPLFNNKKNQSHKDDTSKKFAFHVSDRYKFLMHVGACNQDELVVVECPPMKIIDSLPPALAIKKFAT